MKILPINSIDLSDEQERFELRQICFGIFKTNKQTIEFKASTDYSMTIVDNAVKVVLGIILYKNEELDDYHHEFLINYIQTIVELEF